jgi:hypothetical protein
MTPFTYDSCFSVVEKRELRHLGSVKDGDCMKYWLVRIMNVRPSSA